MVMEKKPGFSVKGTKEMILAKTSTYTSLLISIKVFLQKHLFIIQTQGLWYEAVRCSAAYILTCVKKWLRYFCQT